MALAIEDSVRGMLRLDPHAAAAPEQAYELTTLYCDTPNYDVFRRHGRYRYFKCRLRRYGTSPEVYLERKSKDGLLVRKRRMRCPLGRLPDLAESLAAGDSLGWYQRQLRRNYLVPTCWLNYRRRAYFGTSNEGPLRITMDWDLTGGLARQWNFETPTVLKSLLSGQVVVEFKYQERLPSFFKQLLHSLALTPSGASKYRTCLQAFGIGEGVIRS